MTSLSAAHGVDLEGSQQVNNFEPLGTIVEQLDLVAALKKGT